LLFIAGGLAVIGGLLVSFVCRVDYDGENGGGNVSAMDVIGRFSFWRGDGSVFALYGFWVLGIFHGWVVGV
jgi:hypothetical protein